MATLLLRAGSQQVKPWSSRDPQTISCCCPILLFARSFF